DLARSLEQAAPVVRSRTEPVALVPLVWDGNSFPYGDMRNKTIDSPAGKWAIGAMVAKGTHPYLAAQDFDAGSRAVPSGDHVFTHVSGLLRMGQLGERVDPGRPLMISGGYRISDPAQLVRDTLDRIDKGEAKAEQELAELTRKGAPAKDIAAKNKELAALGKARGKVNRPGFADEFAQLIDEDMRARDRQVGAHPLLPYTPEPNLFIDGLAFVADDSVRFGQGAAEYTNLGRTINKLYAEELTRIHGEEFERPSADPDHRTEVVERARVDALNNRHPLRGEAFTTDFVDGAIETDLSRLAVGWAKDGKLPQSHLDLTTVVNRFFGAADPKDDKATKKDTSLATYRKDFAKKSHAEREPQTAASGPWRASGADLVHLGVQDHNTLNRAISTPLSGVLADLTAGVASEHKTVAAHHLATSDLTTTLARAFGAIKHEVLRIAPAPVPGSLYRAVDPANADRLRANVLDVATAGAPKKLVDGVVSFVQSHPIVDYGHLVNSLVQHRTRATDPNLTENTRAGHADGLAARLIATELKNDVVIHHPDGSTTVHEPFTGKAGRNPVHITHHVDTDGRHTYEPGGPARTRPAPLDDADPGPSRTAFDDESWRHSTAETADWFAPRPDAVTPDRWTSRRDDAHVRTVDTEVADVTTDSTPGKLRSYTGLVRYDVRRIEAEPGQWVRDFTVKVHLRPGAGVDPAALSAVRDNARAGVDALFNGGHRLPSGDQFHVSLEFVDNPRAAHTTIEVGEHPVDQTHWRADAEPAVLAHETLHYLGVPDEYRDPSRVFLAKDNRSAVVPDAQGLMGAGVLRPDPQLRPRHLWMVERVADSQVAVPDTPLRSRSPQADPARPDLDSGGPDREVRRAPGDDANERPSKRPRLGGGDLASAAGGGWGARRARSGLRPPDDVVAPPHRDEPSTSHAPSTSHQAESSKRAREDAGPSHSEPPTSPDAQPTKRARHDDVVFEGPRVSVASLDEAKVVRNAAFEELAPGPVRLPSKQDYLRHLAASVEGNKPVSFVVTAILGHGALKDLPAVLDGMLAGARDVEGKVAFVFGVNAKTADEAKLDSSMSQIAKVVESRREPVALVPLLWSDKKFPYGDMRNRTIDSPAGQYAVAALAARDTHPYLAVQDFDEGSRAVPSGDHVFTHVSNLLRMSAPGEHVDPGRPLMISGGYRISDPGQLVRDTNSRIDNDIAKTERALGEGGPAKEMEVLRKELAALQKARGKVNRPGFADEFAQLIDEDMRARDRQVGAHPLLPYTPEPNLFIDAVAVMADPEVRFGHGAAEYTNLGRTINKLYADELTHLHGEELKKSSDREEVLEQARVDALNNRHPSRGEAFTTDFVNGAIETDLSRLAVGWA
ncbi:hypothetical protein, partial [Lentzea kentuckyensis]|uniref:hypothetical protein n=1 Tax=Lentzea kentuckyensis TaxID=360086 RepID=UPI001B80D2AD